MGMKGDTENMKHVWQIFLFLTVLVSCLTGCGRRQAMEIEEETFPAVSSFEEESQEETEVSRGTLFVDVRGAVAKPGVYELPEVGFFRRWKRPAAFFPKPWNGW